MPWNRRSRLHDETINQDHETMSDRSNENVPRGDHVPGGSTDDTESGENGDRAEPGVDSAANRGHGAHGKFGDREKRVDPATPTPDFAKGSDRGGSAGWGSERSGGSVIDKRGPDSK
jgi:hypothetical protein